MPFHAEIVLANVAKGSFRQRIEMETKTPFPFLGQRHAECDRIDYGLRGRAAGPDELTYARMRGDGAALEPVCVFSYSHAAGLSVYVPRGENAKPFSKAFRAAAAELRAHLDALRATGCETAFLEQHDVSPAQSVSRRAILQLCLCVPVRRPRLHETGVVVSEPNTADQVRFISYLARQGLVSLEKDASGIVAAMNMRALHLARRERDVKKAAVGKRAP